VPCKETTESSLRKVLLSYSAKRKWSLLLFLHSPSLSVGFVPVFYKRVALIARFEALEGNYFAVIHHDGRVL
jgi:hypothetical protein